MSNLPRPSEFELAILRVLWGRGSATVREVFVELQKERHLGYTTVLKTMLILLEKKLVVRDESERSHVYRAARAEQETQASLMKDLLDRAFGGSARKLVLAALNEAPLSVEEEKEVRAILAASRKKKER